VYDGLVLDLYEPAGDERPLRPLVILAPGGGFNYCIPEEMAAHAEFMARSGFVAAAVAYRTGPEVTSRSHFLHKAARAMSDVRAAVRFFRRYTTSYRIDTRNIFLLGHSSGAVLCLHTAYITDLSELKDAEFSAAVEETGGLEGNSGHPGYPSGVRGVVNLSGAVFDLTIFHRGDPLILSVHGSSDPRIPYSMGEMALPGGTITLYGSGAIHDHILEEAIGIPGRLITVAGGDHLLTMDRAYFDIIRDFILAHLDRSGAPAGGRSGN
jgi:hypothetical protein